MTASERIRAARKQREIRVAQADMRRDAAARAWAARKPLTWEHPEEHFDPKRWNEPLMQRAGVYTEPVNRP